MKQITRSCSYMVGILLDSVSVEHPIYTFSNLIRCHLEIFLNAYTCVRYHLRCTEQPTNLIEANKTIVLPSRCLTPFWFVAALGRLIYDRRNNEKKAQGLQTKHTG